jgi:arylsulfatase
MAFGQMRLTEDKLRELDAKGWELYHVAEDCSESKNVADQYPEVLQELITLWYTEAGKYNVLPLDSTGVERLATPRPQLTVDRQHYVYRPDTQVVPDGVAPRLLNRPHSITAQVEIADSGAEGVLLSLGGVAGGFAYFVKDGKLHYVLNYVGAEQFHVESSAPIPKGRHELRFELEPTGKPDIAHGRGAPARVQLYVDKKPVGHADFPVTTPLSFGLGEGLSCGRDGRSPVAPNYYRAPFTFTGKLSTVTVDVSGELLEDKDAQTRVVMARQ